MYRDPVGDSMRGEPAEEDPDVERLCRYLATLASEPRLRLLRALRVPARAADIRVPAGRERAGFSPDRVLSRPAVIHHLQALEEAGLVQRLPDEGDYVVNAQIVFSIMEDIGRLARIRPVVDVDVGETRETPRADREPLPPGPKILVVGGPRDGAAFPLAGAGPWAIGRDRTCEVALDYDPHVSRRHLLLHRSPDGAFAIEALAGATNPARLNHRRLDAGARAPLLAGAVIAVGASRLVLQAI